MDRVGADPPFCHRYTRNESIFLIQCCCWLGSVRAGNRPACKGATENGNHETTPARAPCYVSLPYGVRLAMACQESETYLTSAAFLEAADGEEALARHLEFAGRAPPLGNRRPRRR